MRGKIVKLLGFMLILGLMMGHNTSFAQNNDILEKQKEVDHYLFEEHEQEIASQGITVTHTSPQEEYVEVGITPFNEENVDYLYDIFGDKDTKVVEGTQATTLMNSSNPSDGMTDLAVNSELSVGDTKSNVLPIFMALIVVIAGLTTIIVQKKKRVN